MRAATASMVSLGVSPSGPIVRSPAAIWRLSPATRTM